MEPIAYANGSTLDDPAITYGIVFSNFMSSGVYIFQGGTDKLIFLMKRGHEAQRRRSSQAGARREDHSSKDGRATGVVAGGRTIRCGAVVSNANLKTTLDKLVGYDHLRPTFAERGEGRPAEQQQLPGLHGPAQRRDVPFIGELLFTSTDPSSTRSALREGRHQPHVLDVLPRHPAGVGSLRHRVVHQRQLGRLGEPVRAGLRRHRNSTSSTTRSASSSDYLPDIRGKIDHIEASTPGPSTTTRSR
jgi:hypothetical protein